MKRIERIDTVDPQLRPIVEEAEKQSRALDDEQKRKAAAGEPLSQLEQLRIARANFEVDLAWGLADVETARLRGAHVDKRSEMGLLGKEAAVIDLCAQMGWEAIREGRTHVLYELMERIDRGKMWVQADVERGRQEGWAYRGEERDLLIRSREWTQALSRLTKPEKWWKEERSGGAGGAGGAGARLGRTVRSAYLKISRKN